MKLHYASFGLWLDAVAPQGSFSNYKIAKGLSGDGTLQTARVGRWRSNKEQVSAAQAYAIGNLLSEWGCPTNGLDALIVAGRWDDALGIVGEYQHDNDPPTPFDDPADYEWLHKLLAGELHGAPLPATIQPAVHAAWLTWQKNKNPNGKGKDVRHFDPHIKAKYVLAASGHEDDEAGAKDMVFVPASRLVVNRKVRP